MSHSNTIWHPFTQHGLESPPVHVDRASGPYLFARGESPEGVPTGERRIIDAISSWWVITHGHCHPEIVRAVQQQAATLDQVIFAGFTHEPAEELAERLIGVTGDAFQHVFYSDSGSTSVEVALKMAIGFWEHTGHPRHKIIALEGGYHGDTFGTMSAGGRSIYNKLYEPFLFEVDHIPFPEKGQEGKSLNALEALLKENKGKIAAFIFEPLVQGAAGIRPYSSDVLKTMTDMCRAQDVLLIADEVMTGFGRTGTMFACEQAEFSPDLMCISKGLTGGFLPMGATLCTGDIYDSFYHKDKAKMFFHSSSFTGNPMSCAAANASLEIWENEPVLERIDFIAKAHAEVASQFSRRPDVTNLRQKGSILAMDIATEETGYLSEIQPKLYDSFLGQDVLIRPIGNTIYIMPPYCVSEDDLKTVYNTINFVLDEFRNTEQKYIA